MRAGTRMQVPARIFLPARPAGQLKVRSRNSERHSEIQSGVQKF